MKLINLPIVDLNTGSLDALDEMTRAGRTGVLVDTGQGHAVLDAHTVIESLRLKAASRLVDIGFAGSLTDVSGTVSPGGWRGAGRIKMIAVESAMKQGGVDTLMVGLDNKSKSGWLAFKDDEMARHLGYELTYCTCPHDPHEIWQPFEVPDRICPVHLVPLSCT